MSESTIKFTAEFKDQASAEKTKSVLVQVEQKIKSADGELFLHDALEEMGETKGIDFDSWWYPQNIELKGSELYEEFENYKGI